MNRYKLILLFVFVQTYLFAQTPPKYLETSFEDQSPVIDGFLDDFAWKNVNIATDFVMFRPESGNPEPDNIRSEVKVVYDHEAIYFAAYLYDDKPELIPMEFQTRDNFGNADSFGVILNPQNDGINQTMFFVMSTGNQNDAKSLPNGGEDWSWNAVWYSEVRLVDDGWIVEMKIPYSALRFSNEPDQTWSLNFFREHRNTRDQYSWNFVPRDKGNLAQYDGILNGIKDIKPPVRLSFSPYASATLDEYVGDTDFNWSAGMDLKYGITENFTLDATLIPDFGQVAFDDLVLNLGPFEQKYSEKRPFFTEGVDLFSKGDFFYSRRVGNQPIGMDNIDLEDYESITNNPDKVNMLNAFKISGRTKNGLGIGIFNALTEKTEATIKNNMDDTSHKVVTEPFAYYNVLVVDQQFNKNSSVTIINTNVLRKGSFRDANVSSLLFDLKTKNSKFGVEGGVAMSKIFETTGKKIGYEGIFEIGKVSGKHQYDFEFAFRDKDYDKNDLGYQSRSNFVNYELSYSYRIYEPKGKFNNYGFYLGADISYLMTADKDTESYSEKPNLYTNSGISLHTWATTKKQFSFGSGFYVDLADEYNYYEPRVDERFFKEKPSIGINGWLSTDFTKTFAINLRGFYGFRVNDPKIYASFSISPRYRINNHITLLYNFEMDQSKDERGYVALDGDDIIFGNRDLLSVVNSFSTTYSFNTKSSLGLSLRHYWSPVDYDDDFYLLEYDGALSANSYSENEDINYNIWNFDLSYSWEFASGSQVSLLYRNSIFNSGDDPDLSFGTNIKNMFDEPLYNNFSLKLIYYLDYNKVKTWF